MYKTIKKKGKGNYQMLDNLNSNFESSKAQRADANDDEVEIDLLEIFYALKKKILLQIGEKFYMHHWQWDLI